MGVGERENLSIGALQVDRAVCRTHLLAARTRVYHSRGQLRVTGNESETDQISDLKPSEALGFLSGCGNRTSSYVV